MKENLLTTFLLLIICASVLNTHAQNFGLVKDINPSKDSKPSNFINNRYVRTDSLVTYFDHVDGRFAVLNGVVYFAADDGIHGEELWRSDNTAAGTYMLKDIFPGNATKAIESITAVGNKLYFVVSTTLYVSNGTAEGTIPVPGITYGYEATTCLTPVDTMLYFFNAGRLWKTDGTQAGTSLIYDSPLRFGQLTNVNGTLFFTSSQGPELWKSDGTTQGTVLVKDIRPGSRGSLPAKLTPAGGKLYFSADDGMGNKLWVSDGTANGTHAVINTPGVLIPMLISFIDVAPFTVLKNAVYFKATTVMKGIELYKYDFSDTATGIILVKDIASGTKSSNPSNLLTIGNLFYFSALDSAGHVQLWKSNGTKSGTVLVKNMGLGIQEHFSNFTDDNGMLLFSFYNKNKGYELWSSDGTGPGTKMIKDIYPGHYSSYPSAITYFKNKTCFFSANDGVKGTELWRTNGTSEGTGLVKNINNTTTSSSNPDFLNSISFKDKLYFAAYSPANGNNLYISDGTSQGTYLINDINAGLSSNPSDFAIFKNEVYFSADSADYTSVYKTDGTSAGTVKIFNNGEKYVRVEKIIGATDYLYVFYYNQNNDNTQLWVSDGTKNGSHKIQDITRFNSEAYALKNTLLFRASDSAHGYELWRATSKPGSVKLVKDIYPGIQGSSPHGFIEYKNKLYFEALDPGNTSYIYTSDGTEAGTQKIFPGSYPIVRAGNKLCFSSLTTNPAGAELYISNGTTPGTKLSKDIYPGSSGSNPSLLTMVDSIVYFRARDTDHGYELWKTNGTSEGTLLVKDIVAGPSGSYPDYFTATKSKLYFTVYSSILFELNGLYESNGEDNGTVKIVDQGLGINSAVSTGSGDRLFIESYTYALGNELYAAGSPGFAPKINNAIADNLVKNETFTASLLGNPVQNELRFSVNSVKEQHAQIVVTDISGKVLVNKNESLYKGINNISYATNTWASGVYTLNIVAEDGSVILLKAVK